MMDEKLLALNIIVLCGGVGAEREISLISGDEVFKALQSSGARVEKIIITDNLSALAGKKIDLCFLALHGEFGEDGGIQRLLTAAQIPYIGSDPIASKLAMNKQQAKTKIAAADVPVAAGFIAEHGTSLAQIKENFQRANLNFPVVIKPNNRGSSVGMTIVRAENNLAAGLEKAWKYAAQALIEEFITGIEITVGLVDGEILPLVEVRTQSEFYDYQAKYFTDDTQYFCPARISPALTKELRAHARKIWFALNLQDLARVDFIVDEQLQKITALEANTLPGFTPHSLLPKAALAMGIDFPALCWQIIASAARRYNLI